MDLDDRPVGGSAGAGQLGATTEPEDDFKSFSVGDLLVHSNWKARKQGFEKVQKAPEKHAKLLIDTLKPISAESNAMVQEAAFEALAAVVPSCGEAQQSQLAEGVLPLVLEKGLTGRPKAAQASQSFVNTLVQDGCVRPVFSALLPLFAHRTPKNRLAAAQLAASLVADYGVQQFPTKEILKAMQPLFNDVNPQVRKEAVALCCQCYRYVGASIKGFLTDLRDVQLQELQKQFESVKVGEAPPKKIKGASESAATGKDTSASVKPIASLVGDADAGVVDDAGFALLDESPVIPRLPKKFFRTALDKETTWQTRVEYVNETLMPLLSAPRFRAKDDYHELVNMMKEYLVDPQAPLMLLGFKMIQECARGLRGDFGPHAKVYVPLLLDKLKDKKVSVQLHIVKTLEDLICFNCLSMDQCNEDIDVALQSKNPTQRTAVVNFCIRMIDVLDDKSRYTRLGRSITMLARLVNDEKPFIRDLAYVLLDKLMHAFGEAPYKPVLAKMDDNQRHNMAVAVARGAPAVGPRTASSRPASNHPTPHANAAAVSATPSNSPAKKLPRVDDVVGRTSVAGPSSRAQAPGARAAPPAARRLSTSREEAGEPSARASAAPRESVSSASSPAANAASGSRGAPGRYGGSVGGANGDLATPSKSAMEDGIALESSLPPKMEAVMVILGLLDGDNTVADMVRSTEWSRRQEGVAKLLTMVQQWTPAQAAHGMNPLVVYVRAHPSFREPIFQVFQLIAQVFQEAVRKATKLTPGAGYAIVSGMTPRLSDAKNKPLVRDVCELIAQKMGMRFVVRHMLDTATMAKTPRLVQEVCEYVREALQRQPDSEEAEGDVIEVRGVLHFVRAACADLNNPGVRQDTVALLVELRRASRSTTAIERCVASLPPPLPAMYDREVKKTDPSRTSTQSTGSAPLPPPRVAGSSAASATAPAAAPGKRVRTSSRSPGPGAVGRVSVPSPSKPPTTHRRTTSCEGDGPLNRRSAPAFGASGNAAASSGPPSRVSTGRTSSAGPSPRNSAATGALPPPLLRPILQELTAGEDWRDRLAGLRRAEAFVEETPRPLPAAAAVAILKALQSRFEDANKNVVVDVLRFVPVVVGAAVRGECNAALRRLTPGVLAMLGDQKTALREEARNVAFLSMREVGLESLLPLLQKPLTSESNICRQNVLEMMVSGFEQLAPDATLPRAGMQLLTPAVVNSMMDRILEVRVIAEQVLGWMVGVVGEDSVQQCVQRLKPAEQQVVMPAIERQLEHHRRNGAEAEKSEQAARPESSPRSTTLNATVNSLYDNEESRRTTPRVATPRTSTAAETPHRRGSMNTHRDGPSSARVATLAKEGGVAQLSAASLERAAVATPSPETAAAPGRSPAAQARKEAPAKTRGDDAAAVPDTVCATPKAKTAARSAGAAAAQDSAWSPSPSPAGTGDMYTIREILVGLRSATPDVAQRMCGDFDRHLRAGVDCGTPEVIQAMVERLYENTQNFDAELTKALIESLSGLFSTPTCTSRCHSQLLVRITGVFFDCLLTEKFSLQESIIKALNAMTLKMLEGCRTDDVFSALLTRLTTYSGAYLSSSHKSDLKYIQVTVKCIMRVDQAKVSADTTVLYCHEFLLQHPPSAFRNLDDMPIRTVKTILQNATKRLGPSLLTTAEKLVGPQNLVTHFIRACLEMQDKAAKEKGQNEQLVIEESRHVQRASQSPAPPTREKAASTTTTTTTPVRRATTPTPRKKQPSAHVDPHVTVKAAPAAPSASLGKTVPVPVSASALAPAAASTMDVVRAPSPTAPAAHRRTPVKVHPRNGAATPVHSGRGSGTTHSSPLPSTAHGTPRTVATPSATTPTKANAERGDLTKELADIFTHIRNHVTSAEGISELYGFLKTTSPSRYEDAFRLQFKRCSEAFRMYIKRKLERKVEEDAASAPAFQLPAVVQNLS